MGFQKFGTGEVTGEDRPQDDDEKYRFGNPDDKGIPKSIDVKNEDGSWTTGERQTSE